MSEIECLCSQDQISNQKWYYKDLEMIIHLKRHSEYNACLM